MPDVVAITSGIFLKQVSFFSILQSVFYALMKKRVAQGNNRSPMIV